MGACATKNDRATEAALQMGEVLMPDQRKKSVNGRYRLLHDGKKGRLFLTKARGRVIWSSPATGVATNRFFLETDGNLVLMGCNGQAVWSTRTAGKKSRLLLVGDDGNLELRDDAGAVVWHSGSHQEEFSGDTLLPGGFLDLGDEMKSSNGCFRLVCTEERLVLTRVSTGRELWATPAKRCTHAMLQHNGELVLCQHSTVVFSTCTDKRNVSQCKLQNDGNIVLTDIKGKVVWESETAQTQLSDQLETDQFLDVGDELRSSNGKYTLLIEGGRLVMKKGGAVVWTNPTGDETLQAKWLTLQRDGNLALYAGGAFNDLLWASGAHGSRVACLSLTDDGNLVLWDQRDQVVWCLHRRGQRIARGGGAKSSLSGNGTTATAAATTVGDSTKGPSGEVREDGKKNAPRKKTAVLLQDSFCSDGEGGSGNDIMLEAPSSLQPGEELHIGQALCSHNKKFLLTFIKEFGTLALFHVEAPVKSSTTMPYASSPLCNLAIEDAMWVAGNFRTKCADRGVLQADGALVIMAGKVIVWATPTANVGARRLSVTDEGAVVIVGDAGAAQPLWTSRSCFDTLLPGMRLTSRRRLRSRSGRYTLSTEQDCVLLRDNHSGSTLWRSPTPRCDHLFLTRFGNLMVREYDADGELEVVWCTDTVGTDAATSLQLLDDGNLALVDGDRTLLWSTGTNVSMVT